MSQKDAGCGPNELETEIHEILYPENPQFEGRESILLTLKQKLRATNSLKHVIDKTPAFAIWGSPGRGKTQTAVKFTYQNKEHFTSILFISADREQKLLEGLSKYAIQLGLVKPPSDPTRDARKLLEWYRATATPWLLVYDNVEDTILVNKHWPGQSKNGAILLTSRNQVFATTNVAGDGQELPPLSTEAAIKLLKNGINAETFDRGEAQKLVTKMGCLPLGIQASIGLINEASCSLSRFNTDYSARTIFEEAQTEHVFRNFAPYEKPLANVYFEEFVMISKSNANAASLLDTISLLDPDKVQEELFVNGLPGDNDEQQQKGQPAWNLTKSFMALSRLITAKLTPGNERYRDFFLHRSIQDCIRLHMDRNRREKAFQSANSIIRDALSSDHWKVDWERWRYEFAEYFPHVQAIHQFYLETSRDGKTSLTVIPDSFLQVLRKAGSLCYKRNFFQHGLDLLETAQQVIENKLCHVRGSSDIICFEMVEIPYIRACIGTEIGDFQMSLEYFEKARQAYSAMISKGFEKDNGHFIIGGIANSKNGLNLNRESAELYLECLEQEKLDDWSSPYYINLARCYWADGKDEEASERLCQYIAKRAKQFGVDDTTDYLAGHALFILGNVRIGQDRLQEAFDLHQRALKCWKATYRIHHKVGDAHYKVAWHFARQRKWKDAQLHLEEALAIYSHGSDESFRKGEIARTRYKSGIVNDALGDFEAAKIDFLKADELRKDILGADYFTPSGEVSYDCLVSLWAR